MREMILCRAVIVVLAAEKRAEYAAARQRRLLRKWRLAKHEAIEEGRFAWW